MQQHHSAAFAPDLIMELGAADIYRSIPKNYGSLTPYSNAVVGSPLVGEIVRPTERVTLEFPGHLPGFYVLRSKLLP